MKLVDRLSVAEPSAWTTSPGESPSNWSRRRPFLSALRAPRAHERILARVDWRLAAFPGYARIRRLDLDLEPWSVENGLVTPTMKPRRDWIIARFGERIERLYGGH